MGSQGLSFQELSREDYQAFARAHGTSPEIGGIATHFDGPAADEATGDVHLFGLFGCGTVCAAACCVVAPHASAGTDVCKLDSIIVDPGLRNRGLAKVVVSQILEKVLTTPKYRISSIFSHAVHPATVRILRRLSFGEPPPLGAPLTSVRLDDGERERFRVKCRRAAEADLNNLKLQCILCREGNVQAKRWCRPAEKSDGPKAARTAAFAQCAGNA